MKANLIALFVATTLMVPTIGQAGQVGNAKARGDYTIFQPQLSGSGWGNRSRTGYSYSTPRYSSPAIQQVPTESVAQAPVEARRFSQSPADENSAVAEAKPCPPTTANASAPDSGRRYSYAPAPQYSVRRYSGNVSRANRPAWSLPKTDPGKYSTR